MKNNNVNVMTINESFLWLSVLLLGLLGYLKHINFIFILMFWAIDILITGNARYIKSEKLKNISMTVRRLLYPGILLLPMLLGVKTNILSINLNLLLWSIIGGCVGIAFLLPKFNDWRLFLSYDMIAFTQVRTSFDYLSMAVITFISALCEEFFFRDFIITYTISTIGVFSILLGTFLFFLHHFGVKWAKAFNKYDFIVQILFGVASGFMFYISKSIIPCLFAHIVYNMPRILLDIRSYIYFYHKNRNV